MGLGWGVRPPVSLGCFGEGALASCSPPSGVRGAPVPPCSPPTPTLTQSPAGGGPGPFAPRLCGSRADAAPREGRGYPGARQCGIPGVLLALPAALPSAGHVERPSPAPLGRAGTGDPGRERDERDAGPSSLLMSASGGDTAPASRRQALGPWTRPGNRERRRRHRAPLKTVCLRWQWHLGEGYALLALAQASSQAGGPGPPSPSCPTLAGDTVGAVVWSDLSNICFCPLIQTLLE